MDDALRNAAVSNAISAVRIDKRFPDNVFVKDWSSYLFFEDSIMFEMGFLALKDLLIEKGQASVIALANLGDSLTSAIDSSRVFFLNDKTGSADYRSKLRRDGGPDNWLFLVDRYVCASEIGTWCIYCEKEEDLAVFASCEDFPPMIRAQVAGLLKASAINTRFSKVLQDGFDFGNSFRTGETSCTITTRRTPRRFTFSKTTNSLPEIAPVHCPTETRSNRMPYWVKRRDLIKIQ